MKNIKSAERLNFRACLRFLSLVNLNQTFILNALISKGFISNDKAILLAGILNAAWEDTIYADTLYYNIICWELQDGTTVLLTTHDQTFILVYYNLDYYTPNIIDDRL